MYVLVKGMVNTEEEAKIEVLPKVEVEEMKAANDNTEGKVVKETIKTDGFDSDRSDNVFGLVELLTDTDYIETVFEHKQFK